jgi:hypothetical protein
MFTTAPVTMWHESLWTVVTTGINNQWYVTRFALEADANAHAAEFNGTVVPPNPPVLP